MTPDVTRAGIVTPPPPGTAEDAERGGEMGGEAQAGEGERRAGRRHRGPRRRRPRTGRRPRTLPSLR